MPLDLDFTDVFVEEGEYGHIIDNVNPLTDRSAINGESLEQIRLRYPTAIRMPWEDWRMEKARRQETPVRWSEVTAREYQEMLEILPPAYFTSNGFLVGEPHDHSARTGRPRFAAYVARHGRYYVASRPLTVAEFKAFEPSGAYLYVE